VTELLVDLYVQLTLSAATLDIVKQCHRRSSVQLCS